MTMIVASVHEETAEAARRTVASVAGAGAVEVRADAFSRPGEALDLAPFRAATSLPLVFTRRGARFDPEEAALAIAAGFDLVDVELDASLARDAVAPFRSRAILSFHDFDAVPDVESLVATMKSFGAAFVKIAATPRSFAEDAGLVEALDRHRGEITLFGMGPFGLYSRVLSPFFGSTLAFVAASETRPAAPGQLPLDRARRCWGEQGALERPEAIFAVAGRPVGHSLSPAIHNTRFRALGIAAAYSIAEVESIEDVAGGLADARPYYPTGISITAPHKEAAYRFARSRGAAIAPRAEACGAVNTLVRRVDGGLVAENTDVEGLAAVARALRRAPASAAILGAGGSARAAHVALRELGVAVTLFARDVTKARAAFPTSDVAPLVVLAGFAGQLVVNTISSEAVVPYPESVLRDGVSIIDLAYTKPRLAQLAAAGETGAETVDGLAVLEAQAEAQSRLFMLAVPGVRA